ncbi:DNA polymerase zeta catalytic subunit isoform X8 [Manihot esculenta]|uniref:DNA polymerase zeta catalytic subunit isoform X8 n=1 Tax=Manihot esculenta TaxID=3983 RepID=UPI000B5D0F78|nr:DNA polymerase zeta catalytic subunit isoform X8 [Manihot esculenta]
MENSKIFSVRIVSIDYYMAPPIPNFDICYSSFQGGKVNEVPVIRIYGSTPAGQKTCLHVHRAFPYLYVPCSDIPLHPDQEGDSYTNAISLALEKALKLKGNAGSKRQHVHGCSLVRARKFYGYHSSEELFVKINFYNPHDVSRAANLLLGGAVLDKSLQPHESHIPFILQFLIDYNLYGMGHVHLSKMKFRHPVPDVYTMRTFTRNILHGLEMENSTCMSADFQAGLSGGESFDSPVWISSTIPGDWMWQFSSEFELSSDQGIYQIKRQSICQLEGDATVDEILNQQFKTYASLSQTGSDVKMVQSLIPIWEEEYERSGLHEAAIPPDPGKPLAEDVLKTLSHELDFERKLKELYSKSEGLPSFGNIVKCQQSLTSAYEDILGEHEKINFDNTHEQPLNCSAERDTIGSSSLLSSPCADQLDTTPAERKDACPEFLSVSDLQSTETVGTLDPKTADPEALDLLRWLATSQAADDINSDDELIRETILIPLLPAKTIDEVLEKANMDYESESQKECQDILDSIENLVDLEGLKERTFHSIGCSNRNQNLSETSHGDGLVSSSSRTAENLSRIGMKDDSKRCQTTGTNFTTKCKRKKSLWGSLPFSMTRKGNDDLEAVGSNIADACIGQGKSCVTTSMAGNEGEKRSDILLKNLNSDVCEVSDLVGCSVRDLMRIKRCHRIAQQDCGNIEVKHSGGEYEQVNVLLPNKLDILALRDDECDKNPHGFTKFRPSITDKQTVLSEIHDFKSVPPSCPSFMAVPSAARHSALQVSEHPSPVNKRNKELQCPCKSDRQNSATSMGHCETNNAKELDQEDVIFKEALTSNLYNSKSDLSSNNLSCKDVNLVGKRLDKKEAALSFSLTASLTEQEIFPRDDYECKCCHKGRICEIPNPNPMGVYMSADTPVPQNKNSCSSKHVGSFGFSVHGSSIFDGEPGSLIGMTLNKKPPVVDWKDAASENTSFVPALSYHTSLLIKDSNLGTSGNTLDELLPFFEGDFQEEKVVQHESFPNVDPNIAQESALGVPTHYQNDGSVLYLLTPVYSPPSVDCVYRWLTCNHEGSSGETNAWSTNTLSVKGPSEIGSKGSSPVYGNKVPMELDSTSNLMPIRDQAQKEIHQNVNSEFHLQKPLHSEENNAKKNAGVDCSLDLSQISGPCERSNPTPLSQIGFRDPASIGAGQQLTLLSIEVQAETRGDLRPDPGFDAISVVALAFQSDNDSAIEVCVLLHSNRESYNRSSDGISVNKVLYFSEEKHLLRHFIRTIGLFDPDILMGWDIQGGSLGFLAERAAHLGMGLLNNISRTPSEANIGTRETESADDEMLDAVLHESLFADSGLVDQAVIEDEWGRTHASGVHVGGRVVLNIWRLTRAEVKLNMYTVEAVGEAVLRRKIPLIPYRVLTRWFSSGPGRARYRCIEYVIQRARLNLEIMNQLDMVNRTSELARVFGIDFFSVLSRGSQYRVESMFLRLAHTQNYLAISPGNQQVASQPAMECLPLVMEPESGFYGDPVVVLDFQSLYPSMIIAYNLCFCTCLGNVTRLKENTLGVCSYSPDPHDLRDLKQKFLLTPNGVMYVPSKVRKGILPRLLEEILSTRIMVKQAMKKLAPSQQVLHRLLDLVVACLVRSLLTVLFNVAGAHWRRQLLW